MQLLMMAFGESKLAEPTLRHVTTTIEIDAPPERVWPNVVAFSDLPAPPQWIYRLGIVDPLRARISGVGAVRHCELSTGPFVEPITVWDEPKHLTFDVTSQPPSMTELSPYRSVKAPHLEGYMVSKSGEFRLAPLPNGRRSKKKTETVPDSVPTIAQATLWLAELDGYTGKASERYPVIPKGIVRRSRQIS